MATPPATLGIRHVALNCSDLEAMERFYREVLGYRVEWRPDPDNVYLTQGGDNLALHKGPREGAGALDHFGIMLKSKEDVHAWAAHLRAAGAAIVKEPKTHRDGATSFYARDPEGTVIQFIHHPPIAG